jgi:sulfur-oxidizing protein SoxZ
MRIEQRDTDTELRLLITHPMENGRNRELLTGELIPAHFITEIVLALNHTPILTINTGGSMSKNPFFSFQLKQLQNNDLLSVSWQDNRQENDHAELRVVR